MTNLSPLLVYQSPLTAVYGKSLLVLSVPDEEKLNKRAGKVIEDFKDIVFPEGYTPGAGKRKVGQAFSLSSDVSAVGNKV